MNERFKRILKHYELKQNAFAEQLGVTEGTIRAILTGKTQKISAELLLTLMEKFNINPYWLLRGDGPMFQENTPRKQQEASATYSLEEHEASATYGLEVHEGNVEEYPYITEVGQISRTGWWKKLSSHKKVVIALVNEFPDSTAEKIRYACEYEANSAEERIRQEEKNNQHSHGQKGNVS